MGRNAIWSMLMTISIHFEYDSYRNIFNIKWCIKFLKSKCKKLNLSTFIIILNSASNFYIKKYSKFSNPIEPTQIGSILINTMILELQIFWQNYQNG